MQAVAAELSGYAGKSLKNGLFRFTYFKPKFRASSSYSSSSSSSRIPIAIRLCAVRFGYLSEEDFSTDLDLVQEVGRLINGLIRSLSAPATSH
jgi:hypothetical protein